MTRLSARLRTAATTCTAVLTLSASVAPAAAERVPAPDPTQGDGRVSPFYTWEKDIPTKPGTLLRSEPLPAEIGLDNAGKQLRILYTSTDGVHGSRPTVVSGALFVPKGTPPKGGWPVVAWAHGTVGLADVCAPSWAGRSYRDRVYLNRWLAEGYAVVATDYQGLGVPGPHPLINIPAISYGVLDSIRAVIGVENVANNAVIIGQSQGGAAAFGATSYAPTYAPDVKLKGAVATGVIYRRSPSLPALPPVPTDRNKVDEAIAYSLYGFQVARQTNPELQFEDYYTERAIPLGRQAIDGCLSRLYADVTDAGFTRANTFLPEPGERYRKFLEGAEDRARRFSYYPTLKLPVPIFIGTGASDVTPSAINQLTLIQDACDNGSVVEGHLYAGLGHSATVHASQRDSIPFVRKAFSGEPIAPVCQPKLQ